MAAGAAWLFPRRRTLLDRAGRAYEVVVLAELARPGQRRPAWSIPDEELVAAVRAHAGDRWVEALEPPP